MQGGHYYLDCRLFLGPVKVYRNTPAVISDGNRAVTVNNSINLIDIYAYDKVKADLKEQLLRWYLRTSDNPDWKRERNV